MGSMPKTKKKNIPKSVNEMSKEVLQETLKKKRECNAKALETVEKLCEESVEEEWFLENLQFINQCHFDDVTVERAISKMCGYPLCNKVLEKVPTQKYHISTRYNKVFDITERKNFCSSCCYKSAMYVKKQLFTSPLWFRDQEVIPKYKVLKSKSSLGEEVIFFPDKIQPEVDDIREKSKEQVLNPDKSINDLEEKCLNLTIKDSGKKVLDTECKIVQTSSVSSNEKTENNIKETIINDNNINIKEDKQHIRATQVEITEVQGSSTNVKANKPEKAKIKAKPEPVDVVRKIEKSIFEWFSLDTLFYLYGEQKLKDLFQDKANKIKEILNSKLSMAVRNEKIDRMIKLYGLFDTDSFSNKEIKTNLKPLPDYSALKEEGKSLEIKVKAFYQGQLEVKATPEKEEKKKEEENDTESEPIYLPLIDAHAQIALRRKIVLDKLNRVLPELMKAFNSDFVLQMNDVRNLVTTFTLGAQNIVFKPVEWYFVGTILIKLLSLKNENLDSVMKLESSKNQVELILMNYELPRDYLDNLIIRLTDSENLMAKLNDINR